MQWEMCTFKTKEYSVSYAREKQERMKQYYMEMKWELKQLNEMLNEDVSGENIEEKK